MKILNETEDIVASDASTRRFEIVYPMRINIMDHIKHFRERLPERYNTEDNIYQYFQSIGGSLMAYALMGMIKKRSRFWVAGKIPEENVWPVFACALDNITPTYVEIALITFFPQYADLVTRKKKINLNNFFRGNVITPEGKAIQQVIVSEPYASKTQYDGIYNGGNMMEAFCQMTACYKLSDGYIESETNTFCCQNGYSAMGFIKKAITSIVSAILTEKLQKGSQFRIQSHLHNPAYCLLRYDGVNVASNTIYFTAISVTSNVNDSDAPIITVIDTTEKVVSSKEIEQRRKDQIQHIDTDILNKKSNFERGQDFKMSDKYKNDRYERQKLAESIIKNYNNTKKTVTINETQLRNIISEAIKSILREYRYFSQ